MLAELLLRDNESRTADVRECLAHARPGWLARRAVTAVALLVGLPLSFATDVVPDAFGVFVLLFALAGEMEIALATATPDRRSFDRRSAIAGTAADLFAVMAAGTTGIHEAAVPLTLLTLVVARSFFMQGAWLVLPVAVLAIFGTADAIHVAGPAFPPRSFDDLAAVGRNRWLVTLVVSGAGLPFLALLVRSTVARLMRDADEAARAARLLGEAEDQLRESRAELEETARVTGTVVAQSEQLEERNRLLSITNAVSFAVSEPMNDRDSIERATRLVARLMGARSAELSLLAVGEQPAQHIAVAVEAGVPDPPLLTSSLIDEVAASGIPRTWSPTEDGDDGPTSYAVAPLVAKGRTLGAFALASNGDRVWNDQDRHLMLLVGREMGASLENARLYQEAVTKGEREALVTEITRELAASANGERAMAHALEALLKPLKARALAIVRSGVSVPLATVGDAGLLADRAFRTALRTAPSLVSDRWQPLVFGGDGAVTLSPAMRETGVETLVMAPVIAAQVETAQPQAVEGAGVSGMDEVVGVIVAALDGQAMWGAAQTELLSRVASTVGRRIERDEFANLRERRINELSGLAEIASIMQSGADPDRLYGGFARVLAKLLPYRRLYIARLDDRGELAELPRFGPDGRPQPIVPWSATDLEHEWFAVRSATQWSANDGDPPSFVQREDRAGLVIPLRPKGQLLGLVMLAFDRQVDPDQLKIVEQAVEQLALALDGARLYQQATERLSHIQAFSYMAQIMAKVVDLREAFDSFAEEVRWLIPFERAVLLLIDEDGETIRPHATYPESADESIAATPMAGSASVLPIDAGAAVAISRDDERYQRLDWSLFGGDVRHVAAVPIRQGGETLGVFALIHSSGEAYTQTHLDAIEEMSGLLGVTIERLRLYERAEHTARHDGLTGLPNYRYLQERVAELASSGDSSTESAFIVVDMDELKLFNDVLGHEAGDQVVRIVARELRNACRAQDFVARTGGDEFVMVMEDISAEEAAAISERMHDALRNAHLELQDAPATIRISIGVAMMPGDAATPDAALEAADQAMYVAKFGGGDSTRLARDRTTDARPRMMRRRETRLIELILRAVSEGATEHERAAISLAERYALGVAEQLRFPDEVVLGLRMLVNAEGALRLKSPRTYLDQHAGRMMRRGVIAEWRERDEAAAQRVLSTVPVFIELAWLQIVEPDGPGLTAEQALARVRSSAGGQLPEYLLDIVEQVATSGEVERRGSPRAA